jgi:hypothetical protein
MIPPSLHPKNAAFGTFKKSSKALSIIRALSAIHQIPLGLTLTIGRHKVVRHRDIPPFATSLTSTVDGNNLILIEEHGDEISPRIRVSSSAVDENHGGSALVRLPVDVVPELVEVSEIRKQR